MMQMTTCWWAARRLDRFVDGDPSARLSSVEADRVARHASTCLRCSRALAERRQVREELRGLGRRRRTDAEALERLDAVAATLRSTGTGSA